MRSGSRTRLLSVGVVAVAVLAPTSVGAVGNPDPLRLNPALASAVSAAPIGTTRVVSLRYDGRQTLRRSTIPAVSSQGQFVAFSSRARIIAGPASLASFQVFVRDMETDSRLLVSRARDGGGGNGDSGWPSISADGTRIVYTSGADNLVRGDTNGAADIFMYDTTTGTTTLVSQAPNGDPANRRSFLATISADGTHIVFTSSATNIVRGSGDFDNVFIYDIAADTTRLVTRPPDGSAANYYSVAGSISGDGTRVTYRSGASNLVRDDTNGRDDVFLYSATTDTNKLISRTSAGESANADSVTSSISADGSTVAYYSNATDLSNDPTNTSNVFVYDVAAASTTLISRGRDGQPANNQSYYPSISGDGTLIAYTSAATDLVAADEYAGSDIFVYDTTSGSTRLITKALDGSAASDGSDRASISVDGTHVGYESRADNLVQGDNDAGFRPLDVFLYRLS